MNQQNQGLICYGAGASSQAKTYEAENRMVGEATAQSSRGQFDIDSAACTPFGGASLNRVTATPPPAPPVTPNVVYGPDGKFFKDGPLGSLYWDGNAPLFSLNSSGQLNDIKIGDYGSTMWMQRKLS